MVDPDLAAALAPTGPGPDEVVLPQIGSWDAENGGTSAVEEAEYGEVSYFGTRIRVILDPLSLELSFEEFMDLAAGLEGADDPRAFGAIRQFLRTVIHEDDFNRFWRIVKQNRQDVMAQMGFAKWLVEEITRHPTEQPSDSADGRLHTPPNSEGDVSSRVQARLEDQGRPDLALVVLTRREAVAASGT